MHIYYHTPIDNQWEFAFMAQGIQMRPCNNLEGWNQEGDGREVQEGGDICIPMAEFILMVDRKQQNSVKRLTFN